MEIVPLDETQLASIHPGDPATLCIDAYGRCFPGHVQSVQAGSGTAFSLLPAENATGNYVKVVPASEMAWRTGETLSQTNRRFYSHHKRWPHVN